MGDAKIAAYRKADLFVLPTLNENFAITVAKPGGGNAGHRDQRCAMAWLGARRLRLVD